MKYLLPNIKFLAALLPLLVMVAQEAQAIPAFARREGVSCTVCHSIIPKLNKVGYEFRASGYRFGDKIGKDVTSKNLSDYISAKLSGSIKYSATNDDSALSTSNPGIAITSGGGSIYPLVGPWGTNYAVMSEFGYSNAGLVSINDLQMRGVWGSEDSHLNARFGMLTGVEGFGAMDRGYSGSMAFKSVKAKEAITGGTHVFAAGAVSGEPGIEVGYTMGDLDVAFAVKEGMYLANQATVLPQAANSYAGTVANGSTYTKDVNDPNYNKHDYLFTFNQFFGDNSAIGGYYAKGTVTSLYGQKSTQPIAAGSYSKMWTNEWSKLHLFGTYGFSKELSVLLGWGTANDLGYTTNDSTGTTTSIVSGGYSAELNYRANERVGYYLRGDYSDPNKDIGGTSTTAYSFGVNASDLQGGQINVDYAKSFANDGSKAQSTIASESLTVKLSYIF